VHCLEPQQSLMCSTVCIVWNHNKVWCAVQCASRRY